MKAVISDRIYLEVLPHQQQNIDKELTYAIPSFKYGDPPLIIKNMAMIRQGLVAIPVGRLDLIPTDHEITDKRTDKPVEFPKFNLTLRPSQQEVYDQIGDGGIINAWVSWGKTFTGLAIAGKLGQKTLVVTHTLALRKQWEDEVEKVFGFKAGIIGSGKFEIDHPIVIGNIQSLYRKIPQIRQEFGTIILDEMHHCSAPTFSRIIDKNCAKHKIGLTGTLQRKDGRHVVFRDYFGDNVLKPPKENFMVPKINILRLDIRFMDGNNIPWANRVNELAYNPEYQHSVAMTAASYAAKGHKVLVVSDRVDFLKNCAKLTGDNAVCVTGAVHHEDRADIIKQIFEDKDVLYGTQSIFSEGISLNILSCLILATPVNNEPLLTQLIGRIIRDYEDKKQPIVVDINLIGKTASRQASMRMGYYLKEGYEISTL
jgi:superfamily II DNA or RNA helicase